jgi:hypothetical protein
MKFRVFFPSAKWFGKEFRAFLSSVEWFGTKLQSSECFSRKMATLTATKVAEKILLNRHGMVFVIPQKKVLLSRN